MLEYRNGERQEHIWLYMLQPSRRGSLEDLQQSDRRADEAITKALAALGYDALTYCAID